MEMAKQNLGRLSLLWALSSSYVHKQESIDIEMKVMCSISFKLQGTTLELNKCVQDRMS